MISKFIVVSIVSFSSFAWAHDGALTSYGAHSSKEEGFHRHVEVYCHYSVNVNNIVNNFNNTYGLNHVDDKNRFIDRKEKSTVREFKEFLINQKQKGHKVYVIHRPKCWT